MIRIELEVVSFREDRCAPAEQQNCVDDWVFITITPIFCNGCIISSPNDVHPALGRSGDRSPVSCSKRSNAGVMQLKFMFYKTHYFRRSSIILNFYDCFRLPDSSGNDPESQNPSDNLLLSFHPKYFDFKER